MTREDMLSKIDETIKIMQPMLERAGCSDRIVFPENPHKYSDDKVQECYDWLKKFFNGPYKGVRHIWNMQPEEHWERAMRWKITNTREMKLLNTEFKKLYKAAINSKRPKMVKKVRKLT